jgi:hypothetical protein
LRKPATPWLDRVLPGEKLLERQLIAAASRPMASLCTALTNAALLRWSQPLATGPQGDRMVLICGKMPSAVRFLGTTPLAVTAA